MSPLVLLRRDIPELRWDSVPDCDYAGCDSSGRHVVTLYHDLDHKYPEWWVTFIEVDLYDEYGDALPERKRTSDIRGAIGFIRWAFDAAINEELTL